MEAEEKAKELIDELGKETALYAINWIIDEVNRIDAEQGTDGRPEYWKEVKSHIKKSPQQ